MSAETATFDDLQGWNYSALARTYRVRSGLAELSEHARKHLEIAIGLRGIVRDLRTILDMLHRPFIEELSNEQRLDIAQSTGKVYEGNANILRRLRTTDLGFWTFLYTAPIESLDRYNLELHAHTVSFKNVESAVLSFSHKDQQQFVGALLNPPEPNERLRAAAERHKVER